MVTPGWALGCSQGRGAPITHVCALYLPIKYDRSRVLQVCRRCVGLDVRASRHLRCERVESAVRQKSAPNAVYSAPSSRRVLDKAICKGRRGHPPR